ncbi:MAG TPA: 50S ribosomal protein L24 [Gammaproteobacteria bacterium]|nr:50S ribosomal protein L24 [Gammaproteobacteria bacterium]
MHKIRKDDDVIVITGKDKGKRGNVTRVIPEDDKVLVENVNVVKRHTKGNPNKNVQGGIIEKEAPLHISNVAIFNPVTKKPDRVGFKTLEDGRKVRYYKSTNEVIDT